MTNLTLQYTHIWYIYLKNAEFAILVYFVGSLYVSYFFFTLPVSVLSFHFLFFVLLWLPETPVYCKPALPLCI